MFTIKNSGVKDAGADPALAVWALLEPAQNGRWVASETLHCSQLPLPVEPEREVCNPCREWGVPY